MTGLAVPGLASHVRVELYGPPAECVDLRRVLLSDDFSCLICDQSVRCVDPHGLACRLL